MLAGAVDAREGLFVEQADQAVAVGDLTERLHDEHVVVNCDVELFEHGCQFELSRRDFVVAGLGRDAELPELLFNFCHELEDAGLDGSKIVIFKLLVLGRRCTEKRATGLQKVWAVLVEILVDQEIFLLGSEGDHDRLFRHAEALHEAHNRGLEGLDRA